MKKKPRPSDATVIANLRRDLQQANEYGRLHATRSMEFRGKLTRAEQEIAEWKKRFDALLSKMPKDIPL